MGKMLADEIKARMTRAMKDKDPVAKTILGLAFAEIQADEARKGRSLTDEEAMGLVRKLVKSNDETLALTGDATVAGTLRREIEVLKSLLPKELSVEDIRVALASEKNAIVAAKSEGQATGIAMKRLKESGVSAGGREVAVVVKEMRS